MTRYLKLIIFLVDLEPCVDMEHIHASPPNTLNETSSCALTSQEHNDITNIVESVKQLCSKQCHPPDPGFELSLL